MRRRVFLVSSAGALTGCLGGSGENETNGMNTTDEDEPRYAVTISKERLELPRDSLEVTTENTGDGGGGFGPHLRTYKIVDGERYIIAPRTSTLDAVLLEPGDEFSLSFTVDNTDREHGYAGRGDQTLWGLNPGTYVTELGDTAEFEIIGEPFDAGTVSHEVRREDGVLNVYADMESLDDNQPAVRLTPTDADGHRLIEEQINQFDALRDAVIHAEGNAANIYTDHPPSSRLRFYTGKDLDDGPVIIEYDDESYRVEIADDTP
jgi:hypothetical protein